MSTALNTDGHDGPPSEAVAVLGTDGLPPGSVPDLTVKTLGVPKIASPMAPLLESRQTTEHYVDEADRVLLDDTLGRSSAARLPGRPAARAGARAGPAARSSSTRRRPAPRSSPAAGCARASTT